MRRSERPNLNLPSRQRGLTAVEYCVAGGVIVVAIVAALVAFGPALSRAFNVIFAAF